MTRRFGLCGMALSLSLLLGGCGGGIEPGMSTNAENKKPLEPGPDIQPNMSGPSTAPPPAAKK
jgi:hypothetical protein